MELKKVDMDNLNEILLAAYKEGRLINVVTEKARENWDHLDVLVEELARLHNCGDIDLIASFSTLKNNTDSNPDFFSARYLLEKSLSKLDAPVEKVMECVINLLKEAGQDLAAGTILSPFVDFCANNHSRSEEAITLIEKFPGKYFDLLPQVIIAGARLDIELYLDEAIRFANHADIELRRRSVFSLGRIEHLDKSDLINKAISCLESSVIREADDRLLGGLIDSASNLLKHSNMYTERITNIINLALTKGNDLTFHAGAALFGFKVKEMPAVLLDCLLTHLLRIKPENKGSIKYLDYGLASLTEQGSLKGLDFLENLVLSNSEQLSIDVFEGTMRELFKNQDNILNQLMTRWFIK